MIRIAAFPKCWINELADGRMDLFDWIETSRQLECDGLEMYSEFLKDRSAGQLSRVRSAVESTGMVIPMMCFSPDFTIPDAKERVVQVRKQIDMIRVTAELGGGYCRTLSGQNRPEVPVETAMDWVVECIEACLPAAEEAGIKLVIENHYKDGFWTHREFAQKMDRFLEILRRIDSPTLGVQFDPSNAFVAGDDPISLLDAVLPRVLTCHASDRYLLPGTPLEELYQSDGTVGYLDKLVHGVTGEGTNDYEAIFTRLSSLDRDLWISIEDGENGLDEMKRSVDFLKGMRARHGLAPKGDRE